MVQVIILMSCYDIYLCREVRKNKIHFVSFYHCLVKFRRQQIAGIFLTFSRKEASACLKSQYLFSGENKKNVSKCPLLKNLPNLLSIIHLSCGVLNYVPHQRGDILFLYADPVLIGITSCLHSISLINGWILAKLT